MLKTFRKGGIHPPGNKLSAQKELKTFPLPAQTVFLLNQSLGAPAEPLVSKGDEVKVGTLIAKANGFISANVHSSVSGKVTKIDKVYDISGYKHDAIFVDVEGDEWEPAIDRSPAVVRECRLESKEIIDRIAEAGIVGLGGAAFPTNVKLLSAVNKADTLIINGTECEPYLTDDHTLMMLHGEELLVGTSILMKAIGVKRAIIGIENNKKDCIEKLSRLAQEFDGVEVAALKERYPQGGEKQLIDALLRRQVPSGKLPADVRCVVQNVGTTFAVYEAIQKNKPLVERILTVTGKPVTHPCDVKVRVGTTVGSILHHFETTAYDKLIVGGPMMGKAIVNDDVPIVKASSGILLMSPEESLRKEMKECIRCAKCVDVCPMGLVPTSLMTYTEYEDWAKAEKFHINDCIECGSCTYTCPSARPLLDYIRYGKNTVLTLMRNRK